MARRLGGDMKNFRKFVVFLYRQTRGYFFTIIRLR